MGREGMRDARFVSAARRTAGLFLALALPSPSARCRRTSASRRRAKSSRTFPGFSARSATRSSGSGRYPGEDFARGEFFLGEGDDDTNKTHAVGILVKDEAGRLADDHRRQPARTGRGTIRGSSTRGTRRRSSAAFAAAGVEVVRSDYSAAELEKLLPAVLKAVVDKKNLLKK